MRQLEIDGGFENTSWSTYWPAYNTTGTHTDTQDATFYYAGLNSFKIVSNGGAIDGGISQGPSQNSLFSVMPAGKYLFSACIKTGASVTNAHAVLRDTGFGVQVEFHQTTASQDWTQYFGTFTADGVKSYEILLGLGSYGSGASDGTAYFDKVYVTPITLFTTLNINGGTKLRPRPFAPGIAR